MSDLARQQPAPLVINSIDDLQRLAKLLSASGYFSDAKAESQAFVKILAGQELGIPAFASMTGIHIIGGKPALGANMIAAMIKRSGKYDYLIEASTSETCIIIVFERRDNKFVQIGRTEFTAHDARKAQTKNMDKFPRDMLFARCITRVARSYCPDIFLGIPAYTPEELGAEMDENGDYIEVMATEVKSQTSPVPPVPQNPVKTDEELINEAVRKKLMDSTSESLKKLEWSVDQGRRHLMKTYKDSMNNPIRSRQLLSIEQLSDFDRYLESLLTPIPENKPEVVDVEVVSDNTLPQQDTASEEVLTELETENPQYLGVDIPEEFSTEDVILLDTSRRILKIGDFMASAFFEQIVQGLTEGTVDPDDAYLSFVDKCLERFCTQNKIPDSLAISGHIRTLKDSEITAYLDNFASGIQTIK
jgi:hypothetical protein